MSSTRNFKKVSQKQEKEVAKKFNGKTTLASGALWFSKADARSEKFLIECKTTEKAYFNVTASIWEKIEREAARDKLRTPLLIIDIVYNRGVYRYVVFKGKYFLGNGFLCETYQGKEVNKQYKIWAVNMISMYPIDALSFKIKGKKEHTLLCMPIDIFEEVFAEEL